jgi:hypothetical protein
MRAPRAKIEVQGSDPIGSRSMSYQYVKSRVVRVPLKEQIARYDSGTEHFVATIVYAIALACEEFAGPLLSRPGSYPGGRLL